ncbi:MAG: PAS domain S-box protein [Cohaesibacter sp.]|nr:PAS domain S-box protein [Cohaesibacter sp.]MCV6603490.1 PAS domain S-box protein [Cohaesibacter sp.]
MDETSNSQARQKPQGQSIGRPAPKPFRPLKNIDVRLTSLLDMAADSIVLMDAQSRILLYNKASEALFGFKAQEVIGKSVNILMPPKYADHHDGYVDTYLTTGRHSIIGIGREVQGRNKDGTVFPFDLSVGVAQTEDGPQFIGVMRDLREHKQAQERLRDLQAELNQMTRINAMDEMGATVAHELNQPLTAIILYLQAIERKLQTTQQNADPHLKKDEIAKLVDLCGRAIQEAQRTASLLQRIRSIIEKQEPERLLCDMLAIIERAKTLAEVGFSVSDVDISIHHQTDLPQVLVDPVQIEQVFLNLFRNAFQAMRRQDQRVICIELSCQTQEKDKKSKVKVQFTDNGPGIKPEQRESLFKAFSSARRNGMGLGLAITRSIVQNHGGSLDLAPYNPQTGACFILSLPAALPHPQCQ